MLAHVLEEELERVGQDLGRVGGPRGLFGCRDRIGLVGVVDGVEGNRAIRQYRAHLVEGGLVEIELERKRLELDGLDPAALLRVGQEGVNCRDVDRGGQGESFRSVVVVRARAWSAGNRRGVPLHRSLRSPLRAAPSNAFSRERCLTVYNDLTANGIPSYAGIFLLLTTTSLGVGSYNSRRMRAARRVKRALLTHMTDLIAGRYELGLASARVGWGPSGGLRPAAAAGRGRQAAACLDLGGSSSSGGGSPVRRGVLAPLVHENIVRLYDYGEDGEMPFLVMELVEGANLGDVARDRWLGWEEDARDRACRSRPRSPTRTPVGSSTGTSRPGNVLIESASGRVVVSDFGLARHGAVGDERDDPGHAARDTRVLVARAGPGRDSETRDRHVRARLPALLAALGADAVRGRRPAGGRASPRARDGAALSRSCANALPKARCSSMRCSRRILATGRRRSRCSSGSVPRPPAIPRPSAEAIEAVRAIDRRLRRATRDGRAQAATRQSLVRTSPAAG